MSIEKQDPPFAVQLEPVEGCSLACSFCALQSIRDNGADAMLGVHGKNSVPYRFADPNLIERIAQQIARLKWNPRIEFAMHGEPTMHPDLPRLVHRVRKWLPKAYLMLTTNGSGITTMDKVRALFDAGLDTLAFDNYQHASWREKTAKALNDYAHEYDIDLYDYPMEAAGNPHQRFKSKRITIIEDISSNTQGTHQITNQGGNSGEAQRMQKRCAKPFRELSIRWDGNVALCCDDWRGEYKIGNVNDMPLDALWQHKRFVVARVALYNERRDVLPVCSRCNVRTYRNGLLPDKFGKQKLPPLTPRVLEVISTVAAEAKRGKVFSLKLKRGD